MWYYCELTIQKPLGKYSLSIKVLGNFSLTSKFSEIAKRKVLFVVTIFFHLWYLTAVIKVNTKHKQAQNKPGGRSFARRVLCSIHKNPIVRGKSRNIVQIVWNTKVHRNWLDVISVALDLEYPQMKTLKQ